MSTSSHAKQAPQLDVIGQLIAASQPVDGQLLGPEREAEEALIAAAAELIDRYHFQIFSQNEVPSSELVARLLCGRRMLTSPGLLQAQIENDHGITNTLYRTAVADVERMTQYIAVLKRVANVLLSQVDEVATLAAVSKTRKGQQLIEQARAARAVYGRASKQFSEKAKTPRTTAIDGGAA